ncbi:phosphotransferase [Paenibacillus sp. OSY-SE]|uniref:phosphotransferase n=1 Tax=Paenibacillus sp. OSY-SE TaxID=1196323 RepID=UPI0002D2FD3B|nr:phosphotransferase [Paenibacillus sp. OSY-SE]
MFMNEANYELLSQHYPIGHVNLIDKMDQGMTSEARLVVTTEGRYILRKLKNEDQGMTEYNIYKRLEPYKITPEIVLSKQETPYIRLDDSYYNLQRYIESYPRQSSIDFYQLGQTVSLFHYAMRDAHHIIGQKDRFCLQSMWDDVRELKNGFDIIQAIQHPVERAISYCHEKSGFIHADLGVWNILNASTGVYIIDFGEVRCGNPHFDLAAILTSTIDWDAEKEHSIASLREFYRGYLNNGNHVDATILQENFHLWMVRGMVATIKQFGINERTCKYCNMNMKRLHQFDDIIKQA